MEVGRQIDGEHSLGGLSFAAAEAADVHAGLGALRDHLGLVLAVCLVHLMREAKRIYRLSISRVIRCCAYAEHRGWGEVV